MAGGKELATDDPGVRKAADFAVGQLAGQSNSLVPPTLEEVTSAALDDGTYSLKLKMKHGTATSSADVTVVKKADGSYSLGPVNK